MTEPVYDDTTERLYVRGFPEHYRTEDINQDWTLKRFMSGMGAQQYEVDALIDRFSYTPPEDGVPSDTSDLVDPLTCDYAWLQWIAQLVGVKLDANLSVPDQRLQVANVSFYKGTKAHMARVAQTVLDGSQFVSIRDHTITAGSPGAAGQWDMLIVTLASETLSDPIAAIIAAGAKPAGVELNHETFTSSWDDWEAEHPDWDSWDSSSWTTMEESGL